MKQLVGSGFALARCVAPPRRFARLWLASALIVASTVATAAGSNDPAAQTATAISGKWAPRKLHFTYVGFTASYTCDGLRDQMKQILLQLGARKDLVVKPSGCTRLEGPEPFPGVDATFSVLEPAGDDPGTAKSQGLPARWDKVTLDSDTHGRTRSGGCELIEQVKKSVLSLFTTRNLTYSSDCFPHAESLTGARLSVEVLRPVKPTPPQTAPP